MDRMEEMRFPHERRKSPVVENLRGSKGYSRGSRCSKIREGRGVILSTESNDHRECPSRLF